MLLEREHKSSLQEAPAGSLPRDLSHGSLELSSAQQPSPISQVQGQTSLLIVEI